MIDLNLNPSKQELRTFSLCALAFLAFVGWIVFRRRPARAVGVVDRRGRRSSGGLGFAVPASYAAALRRLMVINYPIGWVVTHVVMAIIFYLVVTRLGVIMRLTGRDPMERAFDRTAKTYWKPRRTDPDSARYFRQY